MTRLVLVSVAGADWAGLSEGVRRSALPNLAALCARGGVGWLRTPAPHQGVGASATLATGHLAEHHRVILDEETWAGGRRPLSLASWRRPPMWTTLQSAGVETGGVAWPGTRAGADQPGVHVDEDFIQPSGAEPSLWALPPRCAPPDVRAALRDRRVHPTDITAAMLTPLVPQLAELDQARDTSLPRLAVAMARAATAQAAAARIFENAQAEAVFIHHAWLGEVRAAFDPAPDGPFDVVVDGAWRFLDGLIGRLGDLAGPDAVVLVVSPGWRTRPGFLLAAGPGVAPRADLDGVDLLDVAPTVLARFGLEDDTLPGRPIERVVPPAPRRRVAPPELQPSVAADGVLLAAAAAAGYSPPPARAAWTALELAELSTAVVDRNPRAACALAAEALARDPEHPLALAAKALAHVALEEAAPLDGLADALLRAAPERSWGALAHAARHLLADAPEAAAPWLLQAEADRTPDLLLRVGVMWVAAGRLSDAQRVFTALLQARPDDVSAHLGLGMAAMARRDFRAAEAALREALRLDPSRAPAYLQLSRLYATTGRHAEAARAAEAARQLGAGRLAQPR